MEDRKQHGVDATNREFERYDQVRKPHTYRLAERAGEEEFDTSYRVRTCDIDRFLHGGEADRRRFARELGEALREIGFAILVGHGIDVELYDTIEARTAELFERTPLSEKLRFRARRHGSINQGYFPIRETSDIHPDLVEGWVFCRRAFDLPERLGPAAARGDEAADGTRDQPTRRAGDGADWRRAFWPDPAFEPVFRQLVRAHEGLVLPIMQSILLDLECDPHLYDARLSRTNFGLRLNYYPPVDATDATGTSGRLLGHEDVGMFTFLPAPRVEGLQVLNRRTMRWVRLEAPRGSIILNTGDYVQRITNDVLPSTTHRVSLPREAALRNQPRVSFPMNIYVWEDEILAVLPGLPNPKYPPVRAIEFHTHSTAKFYGDDYAVS